MQSMISLTKKDIEEILETEFKNAHDCDTIATLVSVSEGAHCPMQQCIVFRREILKGKI